MGIKGSGCKPRLLYFSDAIVWLDPAQQFIATQIAQIVILQIAISTGNVLLINPPNELMYHCNQAPNPLPLQTDGISECILLCIKPLCRPEIAFYYRRQFPNHIRRYKELQR